MPDHLLSAVALAIAGAVMAAVATRVQLLPDVIDVSFILTVAGLCGLLGAGVGALRGDDPDRTARLSLRWTLLGAGVTALGFMVAQLIALL
jgi:hypothetical protein